LLLSTRHAAADDEGLVSAQLLCADTESRT
jgi:hypothetical protein